MSIKTDPDYLKNFQYQNAQNLNARIDLNRRYSTNKQNWFGWVFDHIINIDPSNILEIGCGSGLLWQNNLDRLPTSYHIYLSDFSFGMLNEARENTSLSPIPLLFTMFDAQAIPFPSSVMDVVVANHMLYHIPDRPRAFAEIYRVLKSGGKLFAATNGTGHMAELHDLLMKTDAKLATQTDYAFGVNEFTIENGANQLTQWFTNIQIIPFISALEITEPEPLLAYIFSMSKHDLSNINDRQIISLLGGITDEIAIRGSFHITKSTALFIAEKL